MTPSTSSTLATESRREAMAYGLPALPSASAVSWGAVLAGAAAAAVLSLILLTLGTGLGLSSLSPWGNEGASAKTLGISTVLWVTFMQLAASVLGGYIAGRLRTKWVDTDPDEVAFRDTAHGFLAWGVATIFTAWLLSSAVTSLVSGGVQAGAQVAGGAAQGATAAAGGAAAAAGGEAAKSGGESSGPMGYFVDSLFRSPKGPARNANASQEQSTAEVTRIFTNAAASGKLPEEDSRYVAQVVSQRTGMSQQDAEKRVNDTFSQMQAKKQQAEQAAKEAADKARKASAAASLWLFISLLIGAFVASYAATYGGRQRDIV
jgi:hypothetical protein